MNKETVKSNQWFYVVFIAIASFLLGDLSHPLRSFYYKMKVDDWYEKNSPYVNSDNYKVGNAIERLERAFGTLNDYKTLRQADLDYLIQDSSVNLQLVEVKDGLNATFIVTGLSIEACEEIKGSDVIYSRWDEFERSKPYSFLKIAKKERFNFTGECNKQLNLLIKLS